MGWKLLRNLPRLGAIGAGAGVAWSALMVDHHMPVASSLPGTRSFEPDGSGGRMAVYRDDAGDGVPAVFVHSVNAAASAYEMRPLYTRLQGSRPVHALDLPGFGDSDRGPRPYGPQLMTDAVVRLLETVGRPCHVVALSLGAEFAARAARDHPELVQSLALISPTGFGSPRRQNPAVALALRVPVWSQALYDALVSRLSIRYFLGKSFDGPVDELMVDHAYRTSHRPGARFAAISFLAGELFTPDAATGLYAPLTVPVAVLYDKDPFTSFSALPEFLAGRPGWDAIRIEGTLGLAHWDRPTDTLNALLGHWQRVEAA